MGDFAPSVIYLIVSLLTVLAVAWVVIKFLSRIYSQRVTGGEIQVSSSYVLGARQHLYVVNFRDSDFLLGVTAEKIEVLGTFPAKELPES